MKNQGTLLPIYPPFLSKEIKFKENYFSIVALETVEGLTMPPPNSLEALSFGIFEKQGLCSYN
jgi:hypothetical protein